MVDPDLLPLLRCVECGSSGLRRSADRLVCDAITRTYEVRPPGIPRLITDEIGRRNAVHEHEWDSMPQPDYHEICRDNRAVWNAIHSLAMKYCNGFALEVCCGSGRFLDMLRRDVRVKKVFGLDVSIGMLRSAWEKGHRGLLQSSADDLPFQSGCMDTVASSGSELSFLDREKTYAEVERVLKPRGYVVFDLLNYWPSVFDSAWQRYLSHGRLPAGKFCVTTSWRTT